MTLKQGYRTADIADAKTSKEKILNTQQMGKRVVDNIQVTSKEDITGLTAAHVAASIAAI
jgi:hypothetical protein